MARIESWFEQDLQKPVVQRYIKGNFFSLDNVGNLVGVKVYDNGAEAVLSGSVTGYCVLADGTTVPVSGTRSGNQAYILLPQSVLSIPGYIGIALKLTDENTITTLLSIIATVYPSRTDTVITPSQQVITDWSQQISAALQEVEDASAAQDAKIADLKSALNGNYNKDIIQLDGHECALSSVLWEQGTFNRSNDDIASTNDVRTTSWFSGGVYIYNPGKVFQFSVMQEDGSGSKGYYTNFNNPVTGVDYYYDDELAYIPKRKVGTYRIKISKRINGTGSKQDFTPSDALIYLYEPKDQEFPFMLGSVASGGYSYNLQSAVTEELEIGEHGGLRFKIINSNYRFAVYSTADSTSYKFEQGDWQVQGENDSWDKTRRYVCRVGAKSGVTFNYADAFNAVQIEYIDGKYCYDRNYADITYTLNWEHKAISATGITESTTTLLAELPNAGNVEVKMNRPTIKFSIWKESTGTFTQLQDWTHYFYRYTADDTGFPHYYVAVMLETGGDTSESVSPGRRGIKVYTYEDSGVFARLPSPWWGKRVAVLGDSIVQGRFRKGNADSTNSVHSKPWPVMVSERSNTEPADFGIGGATVYGSDWLSLYTNRDKITGYDIVLVCAGTNDYKSSGTYTTEDNFKAAYGAVLDALKANNTQVIAVTPTRRAESISTQNAGGLTLINYVDFIKSVASAKSVPVIDLFWMSCGNADFITSLIDGIHPNEAGQRIIADLIMANVPV